MLLDDENTIKDKLKDAEPITRQHLLDLGFKMSYHEFSTNPIHFTHRGFNLELKEHDSKHNSALRIGYDLCYTVKLHYPITRTKFSGQNGFDYAIYNVGQLKKVLDIHNRVIPELENYLEQTMRKSIYDLKELERDLPPHREEE